MFLLQGPFPGLKTTVLLPSPRTGNGRNLQSTIQTMRSMDGTLYTYVKTKRGRRKQQWDFLSSKDKYLEVKEFVRLYAGGLIKTVDHNGTSRIGYLTINPIESGGEGRGAGSIGEAVSFSLEFEERV